MKWILKNIKLIGIGQNVIYHGKFFSKHIKYKYLLTSNKIHDWEWDPVSKCLQHKYELKLILKTNIIF